MTTPSQRRPSPVVIHGAVALAALVPAALVVATAGLAQGADAALAAAAGAGAGLIGVIVTGISASTQKSRRDARLDIYGYNDVSVTFKH